MFNYLEKVVLDNNLKIIGILNKLKSKKVLVIGDIFLDEYFFGEITRVSTGIKVPIIEEKEKKYSLGGAGNIAANVSGISNNVTIITKIAKDDSGTIIRRLLKQYNIKLKKFDVKKTIKKQRIYVDNQQISRIDENYTCNTDLSKFEILLNESKCDIIIVADYQYGMINSDILEKCKEKAKFNHIPLLFTSRKIEDFNLNGITAISLNQDEAIKFKLNKKFSYKTEKNIDLFVTLGKKGIYANVNKKEYFVETNEIDPVNVSGAGDTVISIISLLYKMEIEIPIILKVANIAAKIAISNKLTYRVNKFEIQALLYETEIQNQYLHKIVKYDIAIIIIESWKLKGERIVVINITNPLFDIEIFELFYRYKEFGDKLVVLISSKEILEEKVKILPLFTIINLIIFLKKNKINSTIKKINPNFYIENN
jgi:rfaE bifunctional protein, domains I & II